jgi:hypothetical protein
MRGSDRRPIIRGVGSRRSTPTSHRGPRTPLGVETRMGSTSTGMCGSTSRGGSSRGSLAARASRLLTSQTGIGSGTPRGARRRRRCTRSRCHRPGARSTCLQGRCTRSEARHPSVRARTKLIGELIPELREDAGSMGADRSVGQLELLPISGLDGVLCSDAATLITWSMVRLRWLRLNQGPCDSSRSPTRKGRRWLSRSSGCESRSAVRS